MARYPDVRLHIIEGYSGALTDMVQNGELDFAAVPAAEGRVGLKTRLIARDREMLVSNVSRGLKPFTPVRLKECGPLKIILPGRANVRRRNIEVYFETHGIEIESIIEMDAMIGTLQLVLRSDWVAILSGLICVADIERPLGRVISPIDDPPLIAEFVVISPARRMLSPQAQLFLTSLRGRDCAHPERVGKDHSADCLSQGAPAQSSATIGLLPPARRHLRWLRICRFFIEDEFHEQDDAPCTGSWWCRRLGKRAGDAGNCADQQAPLAHGDVLAEAAAGAWHVGRTRRRTHRHAFGRADRDHRFGGR